MLDLLTRRILWVFFEVREIFIPTLILKKILIVAYGFHQWNKIARIIIFSIKVTFISTKVRKECCDNWGIILSDSASS